MKKNNFYNISLLVLWLLLSITINVQAQVHNKLVVLYTNDTHSRIEPLPPNDTKFPNKGGMLKRAAFVETVRKDNANVLLLHAGDIVQGTPYYNLFSGRADIELMNALGYDASCLGNHEFDLGLDTLCLLIRLANFPFVATNYDFNKTPLKGMTKKYVILKKDEIKIGIIGIGVHPKGLISSKNYQGMKYLDPIKTAKEIASFLKKKEKCDIVICLSHLGFYEKETVVGDIKLVKNTSNIDVVIGGHSHTFLPEPRYVKNKKGEEVIITQMREKGIYVGRLDVLFEFTEYP